MTGLKKQKTSLVATAAIAAVLAVSTIAIGNGRVAVGAETVTITKNLNNTGINVQTDTNQKQDCTTAGGNSGIADSCAASSTDKVMQSGGIHTTLPQVTQNKGSTTTPPPA